MNTPEMIPVEPEQPAKHQAVAGMAWRDIAASAYRAYAAVTGNKNYAGLEMPAWDALPDRIRIAWEAAVRQVGDCLDHGRQVDETRWAGWRPPA